MGTAVPPTLCTLHIAYTEGQASQVYTANSISKHQSKNLNSSSGYTVINTRLNVLSWFKYSMTPIGSYVERLVPGWWCYWRRFEEIVEIEERLSGSSR